MPASQRNQNRQKERGVVAVFAAFTLCTIVVMSLLAFEIGLQAVHRFQAHDAAEALAYANALQVISNPAPGYNQALAPNPFVTGNASGADGGVVQLNPVYTSLSGTPVSSLPNSPRFPPTWQLSGGATATVEGTSLSLIAGGDVGMFGNIRSVPTQGAKATAAVNQLEWTSLRPVPARVMLLMDFSRSMRLQYSTCAANTATCASINVMRADAIEIVNTLTAADTLGLANFGTMPFWEVPAGAATGLVTPLPYPQDMDVNAVQAQNDQIAAGVNTTTTQGTGTDIAAAVTQATTILATNTADPTLGPGVIVIISDGEPDNCTVSGYENNVECAIGEAKAAVTYAWSQGIITFGVLIDRDLKEDPLSSTSDLQNFFQAISGGTGITSAPCSYNGAAEAGSYCTIAQTPGNVTAWLNTSLSPDNLPIHCLAQNIVLPTNSWMRQPSANDNIYGYELPYNQMPSTETALLRIGDRTKLDNNASGPCQNNGCFVFNPAPIANGQPIAALVEVNAIACRSQIDSQLKGQPPPNFRMRWGLPVIGSVQTITDGTVYQ